MSVIYDALVRPGVKRVIRRVLVPMRMLLYRASDMASGLETAPDAHYGDAHRENPDNRGYEPLNPKGLKRVMDSLEILPTDRLLDYGSGTGRAMIFFAGYPFAMIGGVELVDGLYQASLRNFTRKGLDGRLTASKGDVTEYADIDGYTFFFIYNPFNGEVLRQVLARVGESLGRVPRQVQFIYVSPVDDTVFAGSGLFPYAEKFYIPGAMFRLLGIPRGYEFVNVYSNRPVRFNAKGSSLARYRVTDPSKELQSVMGALPHGGMDTN